MQNISKKTKDRTTRTPLRTGRELRCSGRVSSSYSTRCTCRITLVTNLLVSYERGKNRIVKNRERTQVLRKS